MTNWQLQDAKARFSELIDDTLEKGPQMVTRRGIDTAIVLSVDEWRRLKNEKELTWKDVLLGEGPRQSRKGDKIIIPRLRRHCLSCFQDDVDDLLWRT